MIVSCNVVYSNVARWAMPHMCIARVRASTVFCPHWSGVVGPTTTQPILTTTQPILTTTQPTFTTTNRIKTATKSHVNVTFHALFTYNLTTTHIILGRTLKHAHLHIGRGIWHTACIKMAARARARGVCFSLISKSKCFCQIPHKSLQL